MQDLPRQPAQPVSNRPDRLARRAITLGDCGGFLPSGTDSHPGGQLLGTIEGGRPRPHFRNHLLRRVCAKSGHLRQPHHRLLMGVQAPGSGLVQLRDVSVDQFHPRHKQLQNLAMFAVHGRRGSQGIRPLLRRGPQFRLRQPPEHAPAADPQQIADTARQLDPTIFPQGLQLALQTHPITPQLLLAARQRAPQALLLVRHETQDQFPRHMPAHQPFGVAEIPLAPSPGTIGLCLRQFQPALPFQLPPAI